MIDHIATIVVMLPIISSVFVMLIRNNSVNWLISTTASLITSIASIMMYLQVSKNGNISYAMGGWEPPVGIEYRIDEFNALFVILISIASFLILIYARHSLNGELKENKISTFYSMYLLCLGGLIGILSTGDAFNAFVFLEISSLATYILISMGSDRRALLSAYQYLIMGTIGATLYVIGVGLIFVLTGSLNLYDISIRIQELEIYRPLYASLAFITVGIALKVALFPLHAWLPNAYAYAPSVGTAFLSSTATKVAIYLLIKYLFLVYGYDVVYSNKIFVFVIIGLSILAMFGASLIAIFQSNLKKLFAYSSVAQIGYITLGIGLANHNGLIGSTVHIINHSIIKAAIFLAIGCIVFKTKISDTHELAGLGKKMPVIAILLTISSLSLIGIPGTVGFISKWYLIIGALEQGWWLVVLSLAISSLLALIYVGRVIELMWFHQPDDATIINSKSLPVEMLAITLILTFATVYFGIDTRLTAGLAEIAVQNVLLGGQ
jgi:multicomponent Na+:H+ antiporter subunit D